MDYVDKKAEYVIDRALAARVLEIVDAGLSEGMGTPEPGRMCIEAAVCFAMGLPHRDDPPCVSESVRTFKIALNDIQWGSNFERARGLRRLAIAQLGTRDVEGLDDKFRERILALASDNKKDEISEWKTRWARLLRSCPVMPEAFTTYDEAQKLINSLDEYSIELKALLDDRPNMVDNFSDAAGHLVHSIPYEDWKDVNKNKRKLAEKVVQILVDLGSPGAEFLDLAPLPSVA